MTRQCTVCKRTVLIESMPDPGGICRDCYEVERIINEFDQYIIDDEEDNDGKA